MRGQLHLGPEGPSPCRAEQGHCPYEAGGHFDDEAAADFAFAERMGGSIPPAIQGAENTVELQLSFGSREVPNGDLSDPQVRFYFANGLCGDLAMAVHEHQGGTPYFAIDSTISESDLNGAAQEGRLGSMVSHAFVESRLHPGKFLDSYGLKTQEEIESFYGTQIRSVSVEHLQAYGSGPGGARGTHDLSAFAVTVSGFDRDEISYSYFDHGD